MLFSFFQFEYLIDYVSLKSFNKIQEVHNNMIFHDTKRIFIQIVAFRIQQSFIHTNIFVVTGDVLVGTRSWFGGFLYCIGNKRQGSDEKTLDYTLTPRQVICFHNQIVDLLLT